MEVRYNKVAIKEYMDDIGGVGERMQRCQDEAFNLYNACKQQYNRIYSKLEEILRRAYNRMEEAESMRRSAILEYETARRMFENSEDEESKNDAMRRMSQAQAHLAAAETECLETAASYASAAGDLKSLSGLWEQQSGVLEAKARSVEDRLVTFLRLKNNANGALAEYMEAMDRAEAALRETSAETTGSGGNSTSYSDANGIQTEGETNGVVRSASESIADSGAGSAVGVANTPEIKTVDGLQGATDVCRSRSGNTIGVVAMEDGTKAVSMTMGGNTEVFRGTRSGLAKAYRTALANGDMELAEHAHQMFETLTKTGVLPEGGFGSPLSVAKETGSNGVVNSGGNDPGPSEIKYRIAATMMVDHLVDKVDFGKLDNKTAQDIYQSVSETKEMFPDIDLRFVGSLQSRNEHIEKSLEEMYLKGYRHHYPGASDEELMPYVREHVSEDMKGLQPGEFTIAQSMFLEAPETADEDVFARFNGISINESYGGDYNRFVEVKKSDVAGKWKPIGCGSPRATVDHELGHQIAKITDAHNDGDIRELYDRFMDLESERREDILSGYAGKNIHEFIAEGWSEYRNNPECRPLAAEIAGRLIELYNRKSPQKVKVRR